MHMALHMALRMALIVRGTQQLCNMTLAPSEGDLPLYASEQIHHEPALTHLQHCSFIMHQCCHVKHH